MSLKPFAIIFKGFREILEVRPPCYILVTFLVFIKQKRWQTQLSTYLNTRLSVVATVLQTGVTSTHEAQLLRCAQRCEWLESHLFAYPTWSNTEKALMRPTSEKAKQREHEKKKCSPKANKSKIQVRTKACIPTLWPPPHQHKCSLRLLRQWLLITLAGSEFRDGPEMGEIYTSKHYK